MSMMIVGLGPAGLGALISMYTAGTLQRACDNDLYLVDSGVMVGAGELINYNVRSDSAAGVFVEYVQPLMHMPQVHDSEALRHIRSLGEKETVELTVAGRLLQDAALAMIEIAVSMGAHIRLATTVMFVAPETDGALVTLNRAHGGWGQFEAMHIDQLLLCVGGQPFVPSSITPRRWHKSDIVHSNEVLRPEGLYHTLQALPRKRPKIIIVGRAHSAFSVADRLLTSIQSQDWEAASVTILTRGPVRVTYDTLEDALADGAKVGPDDVCPKTGRVFRLCGLRNDSARRYFRARDGLDTRLVVRQVRDDAALHAYMQQADLVIAATGYTSGALRFFPAGSQVNPDGTISLDGQVFQGIRAMGLGCGSRRSEAFGGEPSYNGPVDGVWHYQTVVAPPLLYTLESLEA